MKKRDVGKPGKLPKSYKPYRNKFEHDTAEALKKRKADFVYEKTKFDYVVEGKYLVDFTIIKKNNQIMHIETKGNGLSFDGHVKRKMIAVKKAHPNLDLRILFYSDGKCGPKRKDGTFMRQSDWAKRYGFKYAIKEIPDEWYSE